MLRYVSLSIHTFVVGRWNGKTRRLGAADREVLRGKVEARCREGLRVLGLAVAKGSGEMRLEEAAIAGGWVGGWLTLIDRCHHCCCCCCWMRGCV